LPIADSGAKATGNLFVWRTEIRTRERIGGMAGDAGLNITPLSGMPLFQPGMALAEEITAALARSGDRLRSGDIVVVAQKIVSKAEGRIIELTSVEPGPDAVELAARTEREPAVAQLILDESAEILRATPAAIIARHGSGHVLANAGIDASNVEGGDVDRVLLWPVNPDASARAIRADLLRLTGERAAVVIADSMGRAWRIGTVGTAIGVAGLAVLDDRRGKDEDLFGRTLQATVIAVSDAVAAAAVLAMGEGAEGTPAALVRGAGRWVTEEDGPGAASSLRPIEQDMFR
jgi:coenzyme F420-0:L-glutamate ligase/coenzyme F420-1:gamma-L-glutamate ligase